MGIWLYVLVYDEIQLEGWIFQREGGKRMGIQYLEESFNDASRELQ